jgi:hypothetical protein
MADEKSNSAPPTEYLPYNFPTVFADSVSQAASSPTVMRFLLNRFASAVNVANAPPKAPPFLQVVMPMEGFIATYIYFEALVDNLVKQKIVSEEYLEAVRTSARQGLNPIQH